MPDSLPDTASGFPPSLADALRSACVELMADYGVHASWERESSAPSPKLSAFVAFAGFGGESLEGTIALRATRGILTQTAQQMVGSDGSVLYADWTCELVNQLLGRLKNKLRAYNVSIDMHQPELVAAERLAELERPIRYGFTCDCGNFSGYLDLVVAPGFTLEKRDAEEDEPLAWEGDVILF